MSGTVLFPVRQAKRWRFVVSCVALGLVCALPLDVAGQRDAGSVVVRVSDAASGASLDGVRIELIKFPDGILQLSFSDVGGRAEFSSLLQQAYAIRATRDGYLPSETSFDFRRGERSRIVAVELQPERREQPTAPGDPVSVSSLSVPQAAKDALVKGIKLLDEKKDARGSLAVLRHAIELAPQFYPAHVALGLAHLQLRALDDAEASLARALEMEPRRLQAYYPLATILMTRKRYKDAEKLLQRAAELDPQGWQWPFELARSQAMQQKWEQAIVHGKRALAAANVPTKIHLLMADIYSSGGHADLAAAELDEFERLDPQSPYVPKVRAARAQLKK